MVQELKDKRKQYNAGLSIEEKKMDKIGLTARQKEVYEFLRAYHNTYGVFRQLGR